MKKTKALSLLLLVVTVLATTNRRSEELHRAGAQRTLMMTEKIAGEDVEADVNNHHIIPRESCP
ncbi:hypothetical protein Bca4012_000143 [Brassica carinata]|uniref:Uncharacterized protein n=1 Tax=Brassica carinata TaxID=52824 RepID=A0A8X7WS38_BRACI|nr:hypothetical protein Bca52824_005836 [Brassica carinata]